MKTTDELKAAAYKAEDEGNWLLAATLFKRAIESYPEEIKRLTLRMSVNLDRRFRDGVSS